MTTQNRGKREFAPRLSQETLTRPDQAVERMISNDGFDQYPDVALFKP